MKKLFRRHSDSDQEDLIRPHFNMLAGVFHGYTQKEEEQDIKSFEPGDLNRGGEYLFDFMKSRLAAMGGKIICDGVAELKRMRIAPEVQGPGIGSAMLKSLEKLAGEKNIRKLIFETEDPRPDSLSFYQGHPYVRIGGEMYDTQTTVSFEKNLEESPSHPASRRLTL